MTTNAKSENVKFWRDLHLDNLELLRATYVTHTFSPHVHEGFAIRVVQQGVTATNYRHAHYDIPAGTIIVINPGELHTGKAANEYGWAYRMFYPRVDQLKQIASELTGQPHDVPFFSSPVIDDDDLARTLLELHMVLEDESSSRIERESMFHLVMAQLILHHADDAPVVEEVSADPTYVEKIRNYIKNHYADPISLDDLASLVDLTPCYMLRLFHKTIGMPPHAYLTLIRTRKAKRLLAKGVSIADAATQTGFADQSHLTKRFKRVFGITPGQYILSLN
jgi:AraC-like DNA-binding protein